MSNISTELVMYGILAICFIVVIYKLNMLDAARRGRYTYIFVAFCLFAVVYAVWLLAQSGGALMQ